MRNQVFVQKPTNWLGIFIKFLALIALVVVTNFGFSDRIIALHAAERWFTLVFYLGMWGVSLVALIIAAFQPNKSLRIAWALLLSVSASIAYMYTSISGSGLSVFDALSLWTAKHEAGRALAFYGTGLFSAAVIFLASFVVIASPPVPNGRWLRLGLKWLSWTPAVPVLLMSAIIMIKEGGGSQALPNHFQPLAVGLVTVEKLLNQDMPDRKPVNIEIERPRAVKNIVMLIDESVRGDYLNWRKGNPFTPVLAANKTKIVNYGVAVSGANCSSYSNAILRFGPVHGNFVQTTLTNPTIWEYAKKAGYRTVYIDGQSGVSKGPGMLQNFMTMKETAFIDRIVRFSDVASPQLDYKLLDEIEKELNAGQPVFIYANKNGAHFPYDQGYPKNQSKFQPTVEQAGEENLERRLNSYFNVIRWSVDRFFGKVFDRLNLQDTAIIYTSDHGQALFQGQMTHCSTNAPDPREGLVPIFAVTENPILKVRFQQGAVLNSGRASHMLIRPTVLEMMGFSKKAVASKYGPTMFVQGPAEVKFSAGDIFGVFRKEPLWTSLDLSKRYMEFDRSAFPVPGPMVKIEN